MPAISLASAVPPQPPLDYKLAMTAELAVRTQWGPAPTLDDIAAMARLALDSLDEPFRTHAKTVAIKVEDFADEETLDSLKIEDPYELTGLYSGIALTLEEHYSQVPGIPPMVWLYRLAILDEWANTPDITLEELVAHVVVHELGHHFGWSDEEMDRALDD
jgi:predicted Zn-dependent protease with MMP-like domain